MATSCLCQGSCDVIAAVGPGGVVEGESFKRGLSRIFFSVCSNVHFLSCVTQSSLGSRIVVLFNFLLVNCRTSYSCFLHLYTCAYVMITCAYNGTTCAYMYCMLPHVHIILPQYYVLIEYHMYITKPLHVYFLHS